MQTVALATGGGGAGGVAVAVGDAAADELLAGLVTVTVTVGDVAWLQPARIAANATIPPGHANLFISTLLVK
jgi:hypothetical protein